MKRLFFLLSFLLLAWSAFSQSVTLTDLVGKFTFQSFSAGGTSDVTGTLDAFSDQTNQYFANNIQVGDVIWDNQGNRWEVMVINSANLLQADVDLRNVNSVGGTPIGVGFVSRETPNMGLSLFVPDNNIGISQQLKSRIESHNMLLIDQYVASNQDSVFTGATAADTSTVTDPTIGDVLVADNGDVGYYDGTSWVINAGSESTWLKPELEAGGVAINMGTNQMFWENGDAYIGFSIGSGISIYDASNNYGLIAPNNLNLFNNATDQYATISDGSLTLGETLNGPDTSSLFRYDYIQAPDMLYGQFGKLYFDLDQDTTGLEGYKLGLQYGKIKLLPDDTGGGSPDGNGIYSGSDTVATGTVATLDGTFEMTQSSLDYMTLFFNNNTFGGFYGNNSSGGYAGLGVNGLSTKLYLDAGSNNGNYYNWFTVESSNNPANGRIGLYLEDYSNTVYPGIEMKLAAGFNYASATNHTFRLGNLWDGIQRAVIDSNLVHLGDITNELTRIKVDVTNGVITNTAQNGFTATTTSGILGLTHTGSSGQLIVQSQDERATFQGEEARVIGDTLARMTVGTGDVLVKNDLVDLTAGSSDFATLDGTINEFRVGTHDIVFEGTDGFYPEWKFETPVAANDWRLWTGAVGLTLQNGAGENTIVIANGADPALSVAADGVIRGVQYDNARHDTNTVQGNYSVGDNGDFLKTFDGEFNFRDDAVATSTNTSTIIMNNTTMELPSALTNVGKIFIVIANASTSGGTPRSISVAGGGTIEGNATLSMDNAYEVYALVSNGTEYIILWNKP